MERFEVGTRMSQAVKAGGLVFLAGQVAADPVPSTAAQTRQILAQIERLLEAAGTSRERLVNVSIWLSDITAFAEMNGIWDEWIAGIEPPARATVEARLAAPQYLVEIAAIAEG